MTETQKIIKYIAIGIAAVLIVLMVCSAIGISVYFLNDGTVTKETWTVNAEGAFTSLDLELKSTSLTLRSGETLKIETNNKRLDFEVENGTLSVEEDNAPRFFGEEFDAVLILTLPADLVLEVVEVDAGAGRVEIETLNAARVDFSFGAGEVEIDALTTTDETVIEGGAGKITIGGSLCDLDLDMGVGALTLEAMLLGDSSIDCGVGSSDITLLGAASDYALVVEKGIGTVTVNGEYLGNVSDYRTGEGQNRLSVSGGIGEIRLTLPEE